MKLLNLFEEYMVLGYPNEPDIDYDCDIELEDWQIARYRPEDCEIIFLSTGESLFIDKELLKICSSFYRSRCEEIIRAEDIKNSALWELIKVCTRIVNRCSIDPEKLENTEEIRTWLKEKFDIKVNPLMYISRDKTIKL